jgi:hypothetical protein
MHLELSDDEAFTLAGLLKRTIFDDRYPLSPRVRTLQAILDKIEPAPRREPLPPVKTDAPPKGGRYRRRG